MKFLFMYMFADKKRQRTDSPDMRVEREKDVDRLPSLCRALSRSVWHFITMISPPFPALTEWKVCD